jgi:eukaryotic-like serine/threonine-protein kinase
MTDQFERLSSALAGRYAIERELGRGGMAWVYLAQDLRHRRQVAIKVLRPELGDVIGPDRFVREIEIAARLTHPHILPLHDSGEAAGLLYYVMPYIDGESLRDRLDREGQLPVDEALRLMREIADALDCAHACGVVHRDVKPENILLKSGHAYIADFGIARALAHAGSDPLTMTGIAIGTPAYMSPEQVEGARIDGRSDQYSLACVLYEALAGEPPFRGANVQAVVARRLVGPIPSLHAVRSVAAHIDAALTRALSPIPADRFKTTVQFAEALAPAGSGDGPNVLSTGPPQRLRLTKPVAFGAMGVLAVLAVVFSLPTANTPVVGSRVAVLPFSIRSGAPYAYLSEGLVDLLSRNLDGAGDLRSVDPGTVLTLVSHEDGSIDVARGQNIARRLGAGMYVVGSIHAVGPQVRLQASLYSGTDAPGGDPRAQAQVEGDSSRLFALVDDLSRQLMVKLDRGIAARLGETAAITTRSLSALKAYLEGERRLRTASLQPARLDSAIMMFQQAVRADTSFALAHYRLAVAAGWANRHALSRASAQKALELAERLNDRDRRLVAAFVEFTRGAATQAEHQYRAILSAYPDDLEAQVQLADLLYYYNPLHGRPRVESREAFNHVLALDPI